MNSKTQTDAPSKKIKKETVLIILLCALLVLALFLPTESVFNYIFTSNSTTVVDAEYSEKLEQKLKNILTEISGVGNVSVAITLLSNENEILAKNTEIIEENGVTKTTETVVTVNGKPYVTGVENPIINSVIIVCDGADDISVKMKISEVVSSALSVPFENIKIYKKK
ncbi:MAG: hypothetical protein J6R88_04900 [Clostridia bacterium]|nr:hypothetical protein [Clostridia bacterium]